ncbi:MAG: Gfo/Idh/MocA family oxidoreductase [Alphaproteobacteria bacterium]|nr:Gfo/Idh/MocA family oxidoreductase [Alphaproteobacteria bacterium]
MIKLGIIGMSEGNGHPYSWSAIINGYDKEAMSHCPFPVIPDYLGKQNYPDDFIKGAKVTHIWTQERSISEDVARAAKIDHIVDNFEDMIGQVDAVLMARDDYQNHQKFSAPFLRAGLPIYIDKPLANSVVDAQELMDLQQSETQIFTCSALRYARELEPLKERVGDIQFIAAHTPKSWSLYSIHIIEPVVGLLGGADEAQIKLKERKISGEEVDLNVIYKGVELSFKSAGIAQGTINFQVIYKDGTTEEIIIGDMFYAFRAALEQFLKQVKTGKHSIAPEETLSCMRLIEMGKS